MACYHPLDALMIYDADAGKNRLQFVKPSLFNNSPLGEGVEKIQIPCGQCIGCRLEYSRQWAIRCLLEAKYHKDNWFVTLTYNDLSVPVSRGEDGVVRQTLESDAISAFMKRLRRHFDYHEGVQDIRFFGVGEYGSKSLRPHYHLLLFGCPLDDLELHALNSGNPLYRSATLEQLWPYGFVTVGAVSYQSAAYVARYSLKKEKGRHAEKYYRSLGLVPEYVRMSRRPGIAREYYDANSDRIYKYDELIISNGDGPMRVKPVKYYDRLFRECHEPEYKEISDKRRGLADRAMQREMENTSVGDLHAYLATKEGNKLFSIRSLVRDI